MTPEGRRKRESGGKACNQPTPQGPNPHGRQAKNQTKKSSQPRIRAGRPSRPAQGAHHTVQGLTFSKQVLLVAPPLKNPSAIAEIDIPSICSHTGYHGPGDNCWTVLTELQRKYLE
ncbi:hypothetical protein NDU88_006340 [Pleurodeles waltl]|uniref:Uncharacterized protein n=1 Tax=Pleurodeles waltl TaxID=8319 RepID=A0AAV7PI13_PLEWA|nr:hypothetical protein NDU88_006340 [Pleurodeles waltl]